jgi:hypothetical protein
MRTILKSIKAIDELTNSMDNISTDDGRPWDAYTDVEIVREAKYVLELFLDGLNPHWNHEDLMGENGLEQQKWARGEVRKLKAFINKYDTKELSK